MTLKETALFKKFLDEKGMQTMYISMYKKYKVKSNPESIEAFFNDVSSNTVCTTAFYFLTNTHFGYDYWNDMQTAFNGYCLSEMKNIDDNEFNLLRGKAGQYARQNWDSEKFWKPEGRIFAAKRLGIELPLEVLQNIINEKARQGNLSEEEEDIISKKELAIANQEIFERENHDDKDAILSGFKLIDVKPSRTIHDNEISLNLKNNGGRITFSQKLTEEYLERGCYKYAVLGVNDNGDVALLLNDVQGTPVCSTSSRRTKNVTINNKAFCKRLSELLDIKEEYVTLTLVEFRKTPENVAYIINKK